MSNPSVVRDTVPSDSILKGRCHCGAITYELPLPPDIDIEGSDVNPILRKHIVPPERQKYPQRGSRPNSNKWRAGHCHCGACRRTVGAMVVDWVTVPLEGTNVTKNASLGVYKASDYARREFCQTCGASLFFLKNSRKGVIDVTVASITTPCVYDYIEYDEHTWVEDVRHLILDNSGKGGGLATLMDDGVPKWKLSSDGEPFEQRLSAGAFAVGERVDAPSVTVLQGRCHCGAVTYEFPVAPDIDLEGPNVSDTLKNNIVPPSKQKYPQRGARPNTNRWRASHCHCGTCRQTVGAMIVDWVNIPRQDTKITRNGPTGVYRSSNHATREFVVSDMRYLFFFDEEEDDITDVIVASITTPNIYDYIEYNAHIWVEDARHLVLDEAGRGGGLATTMDDGLPRWKQSRGGEPFD